MIADTDTVIGWDVGGAHVKAAIVQGGVLHDVAQWPCPLWMGLDHLRHALDEARTRWPRAFDALGSAESSPTRHAATMTGEMVDLFADRESGVAALTDALSAALGSGLVLFAGPGDWIPPAQAVTAWRTIASANWRATAHVVARSMPDALVVDIGSTTTDIIAVRDGQVCTPLADDAQRLADGSLVYQGVVRTPLCALGQRVPFDGREVHVMNEFFATSADVHRLTGELDAAHDQQPAADRGAKDLAATRQRLARMIGRDARDADDGEWLALARVWRQRQLDEVHAAADRVAAAHGLPKDAAVVTAGCGDFLSTAMARAAGRPHRRFVDVLPRTWLRDASLHRWVQVSAPAVAVALLAASRPASESSL
jgi:(4-(4-[2-(gamma-L-glutamylamino)ethyl]phenoxymethyl)furan-2-yl)methanamine synthase